MRGLLHHSRPYRILLAACLFLTGSGALAAAEPEKASGLSAKAPALKDPARGLLPDALPPEEWVKVEKALDRALAWLATKQREDGSFSSIDVGQPGVTSLCTLAFLSRGHQPGRGAYGSQLERAVDYVLGCQREDGLFSRLEPPPRYRAMTATHTGMYNHAIAGLMLSEIFGGVSGERARKARKAVAQALEFTLRMQALPKYYPTDKGGWRYVYKTSPTGADSDLSVTGWQLMFLRSARNAEFPVPATAIDEALGYVRRSWDPEKGLFYYISSEASAAGITTRGLMGVGALSLCLGGRHLDPIGVAAGDWLLAHPYTKYGELVGSTVKGQVRDQFFYSCYYCSQAMAQLGDRHWKSFFPALAATLVQNQAADGSWSLEDIGQRESFGRTYTTALAVLSLTPPLQLLPIFQR